MRGGSWMAGPVIQRPLRQVGVLAAKRTRKGELEGGARRLGA